MASLIYTSFFDDLANGSINLASVTVKAMLVTSSYTENKDTHTRRSDVTNEVTGTGYSAGGSASTVTLTKDTANDRMDIVLGAVSWPTSTITARKTVYYVSRGGASSADNLIAVVDHGSDVISSAGTWSQGASTVRIQN